MRTSRKAIMLLMVGAMLIAATAGAFAQGFGGMWGPQGTARGYGCWQWYEFPNQPQMPYGNTPFMNGQQRGPNGDQTPAVPGNGPAMGGKGMMKADGLGAFLYYKFDKLSAADKDKVVKIMQDTESKILPLQNEMRTERLTLNNLLWSADPDRTTIDESIGKISDLQKQIQEIRADGILEVNKIFEANK